MSEVIVHAKDLVTNPHNKGDFDRSMAIDYATTKMHEVMSVLDVEPTSAVVTLRTEGADYDPVQKVTMKITYSKFGQPIVQEAHSRSVKRAIDRCVEPMTRQVRRKKTQVIDKRRQDTMQAKQAIDMRGTCTAADADGE